MVLLNLFQILTKKKEFSLARVSELSDKFKTRVLRQKYLKLDYFS